MNNYCYRCLMEERQAVVISQEEASETMSQLGIPVCPRHFMLLTRERLAKKGLKQQKRLHDALEDYPDLQRLVSGGT